MKKTYSKPVIVLESFSMSTSIAAGCEAIIDTSLGGQCGLDFGKYTVFLEDVNGCDREVIDGNNEFNNLCYHVPTSDNNLFNS